MALLFGSVISFTYICLNTKTMKKKETLIVLMPVDTTERRGPGSGDTSADALENTNYSSIAELEKKLPVGAFKLNLSDFMEACNDQEINLDSYWITYINIIS